MLERRKLPLAQHTGHSPLAMVNDFPARDREFISRLAEELHLTITWDEYDDEDRNLVTWRFPGDFDEPLPEGTEGDGSGSTTPGDDDGEWEDEDDEEANAAVDRVLNKYAKAKVMDEDKDGDFDARYEMSMKDKMDEWKRGYYKARGQFLQTSCKSLQSFTGEARIFI